MERTKDKRPRHDEEDERSSKSFRLHLDESDDEDLAIAIKLSKQEQTMQSEPAVVNLVDDDADFQYALQLSKELNSEEPPQKKTKEESQIQLPSSLYHFNWISTASKIGNHNAVKINQLIDTNRGEIDSILLTTYDVDLRWLLKKVSVLLEVPTTIVHGNKDMPKGSPFPNLTLHLPRLPITYGVHHSKLMIIYYKDIVRVVVSTANLVPGDYDRKTQGVWYQDFSPKTPKSPKKSDFENTLVDYLKVVGGGIDYHLLAKYDFSVSKAILLTSVPGYHKGAWMNKYGHMQLRDILKKEKIPNRFKQSDIVCQFSSLGSLTEDWLLGEFTDSLMACSGYYSSAESTSTKSEETKKEKVKLSDKPNIKLVWPTTEFVRNSIDGWSAGGSLCFPERNNKSFIGTHRLWHRYIPQQGREIIPPHIKTFTRCSQSQPDQLAWCCVTSSNLSKAAWGSFQKNNTQFMIRNYEMGVLFIPSHYEVEYFKGQIPIPSSDKKDRSAKKEEDAKKEEEESSSKFVYTQLPYKQPLHSYNKEDQPWMWDVQHKEKDIYGSGWLTQ